MELNKEVELDYLIIGAGAAGSYFGYLMNKTISKAGKTPRMGLLEKSRGVGGRLATRRIELSGQKMLHVELGAVGVSAPFRSQLLQGNDSQNACGPHVADWGELKVFSGKNTAFIQEFVDHTPLELFWTQARVTSIKSEGAFLIPVIECLIEDHLAKLVQIKAKHIIFALPAPQIHEILKRSALPYLEENDWLAQLLHAEMLCRWTWILVCKGEVLKESQLFFKNDPMIDAVLVVSQKPGVDTPADMNCVHISMTLEWSQFHASEEKDKARADHADAVMTRLKTILPAFKTQKVLSLQIHKWLFAHPKEPLTDGFIADPSGRILCIGDWAAGYGVDDSFYSAEKLVDFLV